MAPPISLDLALQIGLVVAQWSMLECMINECTGLLLSHQNQTVTRWRHLDTKRRIRLYADVFGQVFSGQPNLLAFNENRILKPTWAAKDVRDMIAHWQITSSLGDDEGPAIMFTNLGSNGKRKKRFREADFTKLKGQMAEACGTINAMCTGSNNVLALASPDLSALSAALDKGRWSQAIERVLNIQPRPSPR
jgi:hypothetical protein